MSRINVFFKILVFPIDFIRSGDESPTVNFYFHQAILMDLVAFWFIVRNVCIDSAAKLSGTTYHNNKLSKKTCRSLKADENPDNTKTLRDS